MSVGGQKLKIAERIFHTFSKVFLILFIILVTILSLGGAEEMIIGSFITLLVVAISVLVVYLKYRKNNKQCKRCGDEA